MKVSTRARYGLRGLFDIAYHNGGRPTHVKDIARRQDVTPRYLEQIFQALKKEGLLTAQRGPRGGYFLARPPEEISVLDVVQATEGGVRFSDERRRAPRNGTPTDGEGGTFTRSVWDDIAGEVEQLLAGITLADLCARGEAQGIPREADASGLMYFI